MLDYKAMAVVMVICIAVGAAAYVGLSRKEPVLSTQKAQVAASFYPLAEFARGAGGEYVEVTTVVSVNSEPHEYEPTAQELASVYNADVFIYNGSGFDPWAERIASELERGGVRVINMSTIVSELLPTTTADEDEQVDDDYGHDDESLFDPHFWLDPVLAIDQVGVVRDALVAVDPVNTRHYQEQSATYQEQLRQLDQEYQARLSSCSYREIITSHSAFGYLSRRYNFSVTPIAGLSPEEELSARALGQIVQLAREQEVRYIFFETLVSPKLAETVANEVGAETLVFDPIEGISQEDQRLGKSYISLMRDNLQNLRIALQCL